MDLSRFVEECKSAFAVAYPKGFWLVLNLIGTATAFPILLFFGFTVMPEKKDPLYYLLSAQAQTLATVFVLAFTFTLVAAQITSRYSQRLIDRVLGPWALWYAVPYGLGILLPFFLLQGWFYLWSVTVSVLIMVYCIISLIPFALAVRGLLSISGALAEKKKRIMAAKSDADVQVSLSELVNIVVGALNQKDYESFELGTQHLVGVANSLNVHHTLHLRISSELQGIIMRYHDDRYASKILLEAVFEVALHRKNGTIPRGREEVLDQLTDTYRFIHVSTIRDHHDKIDAVKEYATVAVSEFQRVVVRKCQILLYVIGERAISDLSIDHQYADAVIAALGDIAQLVMSSSLPSTDHDALVRLAIMRIEYLGTKAANLDRPEVNDKAKNELRRIIANPSENGQRLRNVAEASLSILNAS